MRIGLRDRIDRTNDFRMAWAAKPEVLEQFFTELRQNS